MKIQIKKLDFSGKNSSECSKYIFIYGVINRAAKSNLVNRVIIRQLILAAGRLTRITTS